MFVMQVDTCGQLSGKTGSTGILCIFFSLSVLKSVNSFTGIHLLCLLLMTLCLLLWMMLPPTVLGHWGMPRCSSGASVPPMHCVIVLDARNVHWRIILSCREGKLPSWSFFIRQCFTRQCMQWPSGGVYWFSLWITIKPIQRHCHPTN